MLTPTGGGPPQLLVPPSGSRAANPPTNITYAGDVNDDAVIDATFNVSTAGQTTGNATAVNATGTVTYTITSFGTAPAFADTLTEIGLSLDTVTGEISGTPTVSGTFNITVQASNSAGSFSRTFTITVSDPTIAIDDVTVGEADGNADFTATLSNLSINDVIISWDTTNGTATGGNDFTAVTGGSTTITAGNPSASLSVAITDDSDANEGSENFTVVMASASNTSAITANSGLGTINDNDVPLVHFSSTVGSRSEGDGDVTYSVTVQTSDLSNVISDLTIDFTYDTSALANPASSGTDFATTPTSVTIFNGSNSASFNVTIKGDTTYEGDEQFKLVLTDGALYDLFTNSVQTVTITENDPAPTLAIADANLTEGDSGTSNMSFTVTRTGLTDLAATFDYSLADISASGVTTCSAIDGSHDYDSDGATGLSIVAGGASNTTTITVPICGDGRVEANETFTVTISNPGDASITGASATGTINDNDVAPSITSLDLTNDALDNYISDAEKTNTTAVVALNGAANYDTAEYVIVASGSTCSAQSFVSTTVPDSAAIGALSEGATYMVCVKLSDTAGNTPAYAGSGDITLDTTPPTATITGEPTGTNNVTNLNVDIGGADAQFYQYKVGETASTDCSVATGYSADISATLNITDDISALPDGSITLCVIGKDSALNYQAYGSATTASWTKDSTIPVGALTGAPTGTNNTTLLNIDVGGVDIQNYKYKIGEAGTTDCANAAGYSASTPATINITDNISGLSDGSIKVCVIGQNSATTWQLEADATVATWIKDTTAPTIASAETLDSDNDGKIDHYKITFTEPVDDSTFPGYAQNSLGGAATNWGVAGYSNLKLNHGGAVTFAVDDEDDTVIYLKFDENLNTCNFGDLTGCDTGSKPDVTMSATALKDIYGNSIAVIATLDVTETDGAAPVVVGAFPYSNISLDVAYSEAVTAASSECATALDCSAIYTISPALTVSAAALQTGSKYVKLTVITQTESTPYTFTSVAGVVKAVNGVGVNASANTAAFTGAPEETTLVSATAIDSTTVELTFNVPVLGGAETASNYTIGGVTVSAAALYPTPGVASTTVRLTTSYHLSDTLDGYTVVVSSGGVTAETGGKTCNSPNNFAYFTGDKLPTVLSASAANVSGTYYIDVIFSEDMVWDASAVGALNSANFCVETTATKTSNCTGTTLAVTGVSGVLTQTKVRLTTSPEQALDVPYTVTVSNAQDLTGNTISATANYGNFIGQENIKVLSGAAVSTSDPNYAVFKVTFSRPFAIDPALAGAGANDVDNLNNWNFPAGLNTVTICSSVDDALCPVSYSEGTDTEIYFKATPKPDFGAYTVVAATAAGVPPGAEGCILSAGGTDPNDCLKTNPGDRASIALNLPVTIEDGSVYDDPFNDGVTFAGQIVKYNNRLLIGPNDTDSGLFQTELNMTGALSIDLDADEFSAGYQPFKDIYESCDTGTWPNCTAGNNLEGIDYLYAACYDNTAPYANTTLSGQSCLDAGGEERLFAVGFIFDGVGGDGNEGYQSSWSTTDTASPFTFFHIDTLSNRTDLTYRAMSISVFKGDVYQANQHQNGSYAPRWSRYKPDGTIYGNPAGGDPTNANYHDMGGRFLTRIGEGGTIPNGQGDVATGLISIDYMFEYDDDGAGGDDSQIYFANGGSCREDVASPNRCLTDTVRNATSQGDGGILRNVAGTIPTYCTSQGDCNGKWEDVTPTSTTWLIFMSKALPQDARPGGDWDSLVPANTIAPSIKAIPKMVEFNGDLYLIRNACASTNVQNLGFTGTIEVTDGASTVTGTGTAFTTELSVGDTITTRGQIKIVASITDDTTLTTTTTWSPAIAAGSRAQAISASGVIRGLHDTCPSGSERPQLWRMPANCGTAAACQSAWQFIGDAGFTTRMAGAEWLDGVDQATKVASNKYITLLEVVGDRLYVGFDNSDYGANVWRTKAGITAPGDDSDFEAVCQTGSLCFTPDKQFGLGNSETKIFDSINVNDAGTDYLIFNASTGTTPVKIYRTTNY